jgi:hypothetical protein
MISQLAMPIFRPKFGTTLLEIETTFARRKRKSEKKRKGMRLLRRNKVKAGKFRKQKSNFV